MKPVFIEGTGLLGPGIENWLQARSQLLSASLVLDEPLNLSGQSPLPANERRRASRLSKIALQVAGEAMAASTLPAGEVATVFASSCGDLDIVHKISTALTMQGKPVSPTQFHNSVHNAQAGYWAISQHAQLPSNSISACADSFAMGLLEALTLLEIEQVPVLLVAYDRPAPEPLFGSAMSQIEFAMALLLSPDRSADSQAMIETSLVTKQSVAGINECQNRSLEPFRKACPAAMSLPLLEALVKPEGNTLVLDCPGTRYLQVTVLPCN